MYRSDGSGGMGDSSIFADFVVCWLILCYGDGVAGRDPDPIFVFEQGNRVGPNTLWSVRVME